MLLYQLSQLVHYVDTLKKQKYHTSHHTHLRDNHYSFVYLSYKCLPSYNDGYRIALHQCIHELNLIRYSYDYRSLKDLEAKLHLGQHNSDSYLPIDLWPFYHPKVNSSRQSIYCVLGFRFDNGTMRHLLVSSHLFL